MMDRLEGEVRKAAKRFGLPASSPLLALWPELVGETIAANAWPARMSRGGVLHVNTSSSTWAFELKHLEPTILSRLRERLAGECPKELRFAPGPIPEPGASPEAPTPARPHRASPEGLALAERAAAAIDNEELRELVARAAAASLAGGSEK
jgi:hypothetical protein